MIISIDNHLINQDHIRFAFLNPRSMTIDFFLTGANNWLCFQYDTREELEENWNTYQSAHIRDFRLIELTGSLYKAG